MLFLIAADGPDSSLSLYILYSHTHLCKCNSDWVYDTVKSEWFKSYNLIVRENLIFTAYVPG